MPENTLVTRLGDELKGAMRARDADRIACLRQVKAKLEAAQNDGPPGAREAEAGGPDALLVDVIRRYSRQLTAAIAQLAAAGERSAPLRARYAAEVSYLARYLPRPPDREAHLQAVARTLAAEPGWRATDAGRAAGAVLRQGPHGLDPKQVRELVVQALAARG